ncbi:hypothetical protein SEA_YARA_32 [Streptomyces phage Yara]|nr:hypothetical protein SEA_YARA_32 [Streptomyces phage Yara]
MNENKAIEALKNGAKVVGITEHGRKYEGVLEDMFVYAPVGYKQMGPVHPASAPEGDWGPVRFRLSFLVDASKGLYSSVELTADQIELAEDEEAKEVRAEFEQAAYSGYVSRGIGDTDGWYHPIDKTAFTNAMRLRVPLNPEDFTRYNDTEFRPTEEMCRRYNATFIGKPEQLRLAVQTEKGWKTVEVDGTIHAHEVLKGIALGLGFIQARLEDYALLDGYWVPQVVEIPGSWVEGNLAVTNKKHARRGRMFYKNFDRLLENSETSELDC